jgi:predicted transcriptional regulator
MAGKPLAKKRRAEIERRGGGEYLREWILSGKSLRELAIDMDVPRGALRNMITKDPELSAAIDGARRDAADAHFDATFEAISEVGERRQREIMEALNGDRDISEANVSQVDLGLLKQKVGQHNLAAQAWNQERYGNRANQQININIGDLHLDALRKMKVVEHE